MTVRPACLPVSVHLGIASLGRAMLTVGVVLLAVAHVSAAPPQPPRIIEGGPLSRPVRLSDGSLIAFKVASARRQVTSTVSHDSGLAWSEPRDEFPLPHERMGAGPPLLDSDGRLHLVLTRAHGMGRPADGLSIDLWHARSSTDRTSWDPPQPMWEGYCGAVMDIQQLADGRLVVPFAAWKRLGEEVAPDTGLNYTTAVTSDDHGATWQLAPAKLTSPCTPGFNGNNYGAIEPTLLQLADGRAWLLMRTQTDVLYQSFATDGADWSAAEPSRFRSSSSPAAFVRLSDGRIVVFWNHCETPPRVDGQGVYGGRDALHAAVSADEGGAWRGFREVYRDPLRNETPPRRGDRGTAYPVATPLDGSTIALATGQGNRRRFLLVDADWLAAGEQQEDFQQGLEAWHVWKPFGPASGYWRDRTVGARLVDSPDGASCQVLALGKHDEHAADTAIWNFPAGERGRLTLRVWLPEDFAGADISLDDRFFNPDDDRGESAAVYTFRIDRNRRVGSLGPLPSGSWTSLALEWDAGEDGAARLLVDGRAVAPLARQSSSWPGPSYLRIRSAAAEVERGGFYVAEAVAEVD